MSIFPVVSVVKQSTQALKSVDVHCDQADRYHRQTRFPNPCDVFTQTRENYYSPRASLPAVPTAATRDRIYGFSACGPASQRNSDDYRFQSDRNDPSVIVYRDKTLSTSALHSMFLRSKNEHLPDARSDPKTVSKPRNYSNGRKARPLSHCR